MLRLGEVQELTVVKERTFGVYLGEEGGSEQVLLPKREVPENIQRGAAVRVFLYKDSEDRLIATTVIPPLTLYHTAVLKVKEVSRIGAFLDWGLSKDLLLPFHEQTYRVKAGEDCLVALYEDKSGRLCATMKVYHYLRKHSPYQINDTVTGRIYEVSDNFGVFVAVDDMYSALIPKKEAAGTFHPGTVIEARVTQVKEDGKLDLSVRKKAYLQMEEDAELIMRVIEEYEGVLPYSEHVNPEIIRRAFGLSQNAFKRGLGRLLNQGRIRIEETRIFKVEAGEENK